MESTISNLKQQWLLFKTENPKVRIREAARQLQVSEAELLNTDLGQTVTRLSDQFMELLKETNTLGKVMALTRNDYCVHERKGIYKKATFNGHMGLVVTPDIDLRLFMNSWYLGFAVHEEGRHSLQFFNAQGEAVHKIYLTPDSDQEAYRKLADKYTAANQQSPLSLLPAKAAAAEVPDTELQLKAFQEGWLGLEDTHDFHPLLRKHQLTRTQALRLAPEGYAVLLAPGIIKTMLEQASAQQLEIMVFTGSSGCIQIHTGTVNRLVETGPWFNVLDPNFNLHLRLDGVATLWLVKKPTRDGLVHSLEAYDDAGNTIVQFFGKRKPGIPESEAWRTLLNNIA